ncbi:hypothetical protein [Polycladidibacter hongkongensis]|uniref:hypothetical protein n=1 Tax=Polycladidibacter hongkongensis TaxID=1647556 RepID=UPI00083769A7|nr:hypothetical protein [Pseudovibrio hongkongensis]
MTSYLIDGVLFLALMITTWRVTVMYRKLKDLAAYQQEYTRAFEQSSEAMDAVGLSLQEIRVRGEEILKALGERIDDAREATVDISSVVLQAQTEMRTLQEHIDWLRKGVNDVNLDLSAMPRDPGRRSGGREATAARQRTAGRARPKPAGSSNNSAAMLLTGGKVVAAKQTVASSEEKQAPKKVRKVSFGEGSAFRHVAASDQAVEAPAENSEADKDNS